MGIRQAYAGRQLRQQSASQHTLSGKFSIQAAIGRDRRRDVDEAVGVVAEHLLKLTILYGSAGADKRRIRSAQTQASRCIQRNPRHIHIQPIHIQLRCIRAHTQAEIRAELDWHRKAPKGRSQQEQIDPRSKLIAVGGVLPQTQAVHPESKRICGQASEQLKSVERKACVTQPSSPGGKLGASRKR